MNKNDLKKLAEITFSNKKLNENVKNFVIKKLSKKDLKTYLFYLKNEFKKRKVYVTISETPSEDLMKNMALLFKDKEILYNIDNTLGAGLRIQNDDNLLNINMQNIIDHTIIKIKENL